jgi:hypothetical protein
MKTLHYIKRVKESKQFKELMEEDPKAYLCSLFFLMDFNEKRSETQVDFYSPKHKNIISFKVGKGVERIPLGKKAETISHKKFIPKQLDENIKTDVDEIKQILVDEMRNRDMAYEIEKIIAFLNIADDRVMWNCTGFLKGLGLLQAHVEDSSSSVLFMEKKSFFDMIRFTGKQTPETPGNNVQTQNPNILFLNKPETISPEQKEKPKANTEVKKKEAKSK